MMIVQVVIISGVLLAVLLAGFKTVQTTIQAANTAATSAAFKDLVLEIEQVLATTNSCAISLGIAGTSMAALNVAGGFPVTVKNSDGKLIAEKNVTQTTDFKITKLILRNVRSLGWATGTGLPGLKGNNNGTQQLAKVRADLEITAERHSNFLGGKSMNVSVPLLLGINVSGVGAPGVRICTARNLYLVELGPASNPVKKSGLECIDRGGVPVMKPGADYYVCRLPFSSTRWLSCTAAGSFNDKTSNLPGWYCDTPAIVAAGTTPTGFSYVY